LSKPIDEFHKTKRSKSGLQSWCKKCRSEHQKNNREDIAKYQKKYQEEHRDELTIQKMEYYQKHREKILN